jgi:hypothetical protein
MNAQRQPPENRDLARWVHTLTGGDAGAHDQLINPIGRHARSLDQSLDAGRPELIVWLAIVMVLASWNLAIKM